MGEEETLQQVIVLGSNRMGICCLPEAERLATVMLNPKPAGPRMWANFRRKARRVANVAMLTPS